MNTSCTQILASKYYSSKYSLKQGKYWISLELFIITESKEGLKELQGFKKGYKIQPKGATCFIQHKVRLKTKQKNNNRYIPFNTIRIYKPTVKYIYICKLKNERQKRKLFLIVECQLKKCIRNYGKKITTQPPSQ